MIRLTNLDTTNVYVNPDRIETIVDFGGHGIIHFGVPSSKASERRMIEVQETADEVASRIASFRKEGQ